MSSFNNNVTHFCIICKGPTPAWTSSAVRKATLRTEWGNFEAYFHNVCYNKNVVEQELRKMALKAMPPEAKNPPTQKEKEDDKD
jgi:hypothetical protein